MIKKRLAIIIINYCSPELTINCLESIKNQITKEDIVVLIDNNSKDNSVELIERTIKKRKWQKWTNFIKSPINKGFSGGINLGIKSIDAEYYMIANNDVIFHKNTIKELLEKIKTKNNIGIIGPGIEYKNKEPHPNPRNFINPLSELILAAKTRPITNILKKFDITIKSLNKPLFTDWLSFCCVLIKKEVFDKVGLLDENYFMYYEDVDFCRRIKKKGYETFYYPNAKITHLCGASTKIRDKKRKPDYYYFARSTYFKKFYGLIGLFSANLLRTSGIMINLSRKLLENKTQDFNKHEIFDIWKGFLRPIKKTIK